MAGHMNHPRTTWHRLSINGLETFTPYPSPFPAGQLDTTATTVGLTAEQIRSRDAHHEASHAVIGTAVGLPVNAVMPNSRLDTGEPTA